MDEDEEIIVKAMTDYWVVGKKSDQRELYVILNQKNANLIEVNGKSPPIGNDYISVSHQYLTTLMPFSLFSPTEEVKRLCATQFNNIFFLD